MTPNGIEVVPISPNHRVEIFILTVQQFTELGRFEAFVAMVELLLKGCRGLNVYGYLLGVEERETILWYSVSGLEGHLETFQCGLH